MGVSWVILGVAVGLGVMMIIVFLVGLKRRKRDELHPQGYYMGVSMGLGMLIGSLLYLLLQVYYEIDVMPTMGTTVGLACGAGIGASLEKKYADRLRPLTEAERNRKRVGLFTSIALLILGIVVLLIFVLRG